MLLCKPRDGVGALFLSFIELVAVFLSKPIELVCVLLLLLSHLVDVVLFLLGSLFSAFLDGGLQLGDLIPEAALEFLVHLVILYNLIASDLELLLHFSASFGALTDHGLVLLHVAL